MILSHQILLYPTLSQTVQMLRTAGVARFAYNWGLARWKKLYEQGEKPSWMSLNKELNSIKKDQFPWMTEVSKWATNQSLYDLGNAFSRFFRRIKQDTKRPGYPKFKKKSGTKPSFYIAGAQLQFKPKKIRIPKVGWVGSSENPRFPGRVISARFSQRAGNWYVSLQIEIDETKWSYPNQCKNQAVVGIDLGVKDLVVTSDGIKFPAPRSYRKAEKKIRRLNKELSRRVKGSSNWKKTRLKLQRAYERVGNTRKDALHKLTSRLVRDYQFIGLEDLNVKGMTRWRGLSKSIQDASLGELRRQLEYKSQLSGSHLVFADRFYPSSKTCSECGHILQRLLLSQRQWRCPSCEAQLDRDINAARNLEKLALGYRDNKNACGEESSGFDRLVKVKLSSMKQESTFGV